MHVCFSSAQCFCCWLCIFHELVLGTSFLQYDWPLYYFYATDAFHWTHLEALGSLGSLEQ